LHLKVDVEETKSRRYKKNNKFGNISVLETNSFARLTLEALISCK
jgi:hypothetical protein